MHQKEWLSLRITLVLYLVVLLIAVSLYFVSSSFQMINEGSRITSQSNRLANTAEYLSSRVVAGGAETQLRKADKIMGELSLWVEKNKNSKFYIGDATLEKDFLKVRNCWKRIGSNIAKGVLDPEKCYPCYQESEKFATLIEKMTYLEQKRIINILYISLGTAALLMILTIYFVRVYIDAQIKKRAVDDEETGLFNKKYFLSHLQKVCAESKRYKTPVSTLWISVEFENTVSKNVKKHFYREFGSIVLCNIRSSDIAARYSDPASKSGKTLFCVLMPMTSKEYGNVLLDRLQNDLKTHLSQEASKQTFNFSIEECGQEETYEAFIERGKNALQ